MYLVNAFSLGMIIDSDWYSGVETLRFRSLSLAKVREILSEGFTSGIGHADTAAVLSDLLGINIQMNRINCPIPRDAVRDEIVMIVAQKVGGRLPEGATTLPDDVRFEFVAVCRA